MSYHIADGRVRRRHAQRIVKITRRSGHPHLSLLQEARFWSRIMKEHALFVRLGLPKDQAQLIKEAQHFFIRFRKLERKLRAAKTLTPNLRRNLIIAVRGIIAFQEKVLRQLLACRLSGTSLYPLLVDHITREARHFLALLTSKGLKGNSKKALLRTHVFWLRIMKDHVEFIRHLLDPSERQLIDQAEEFMKTFSELLETSRDLETMSLSDPRSFNTVKRFTSDVRAKTKELRNFKATAHQLLLKCRILSIIPSPLLVDHIRREADKFLGEINRFSVS